VTNIARTSPPLPSCRAARHLPPASPRLLLPTRRGTRARAGPWLWTLRLPGYSTDAAEPGPATSGAHISPRLGSSLRDMAGGTTSSDRTVKRLCNRWTRTHAALPRTPAPPGYAHTRIAPRWAPWRMAPAYFCSFPPYLHLLCKPILYLSTCTPPSTTFLFSRAKDGCVCVRPMHTARTYTAPPLPAFLPHAFPLTFLHFTSSPPCHTPLPCAVRVRWRGALFTLHRAARTTPVCMRCAGAFAPAQTRQRAVRGNKRCAYRCLRVARHNTLYHTAFPAHCLSCPTYLPTLPSTPCLGV